MSNSTRDSLRTALVGNTLPGEVRSTTLFGNTIEIRPPSMEVSLKIGNMETPQEQTLAFIMECVYVPGTNERVFEEGDKPQILKWPMNADVLGLQTQLNEMMGVDVIQAEEDIRADPLSE